MLLKKIWFIEVGTYYEHPRLTNIPLKDGNVKRNYATEKTLLKSLPLLFDHRPTYFEFLNLTAVEILFVGTNLNISYSVTDQKKA